MLKQVYAAAVIFVGALVAPVCAADVHIGINVGVPAPPSIVFESPPQLVVVPGVPDVRYAPDVSVNFFSYGDRYYSYNDGHWFVATGHRGPWTYIERGRVPRHVLMVPTRYYPDGHGHGHGGGHHHGHHHDDGDHDDGHRDDGHHKRHDD